MQLFLGLINTHFGQLLFELARVAYGFHRLRFVPRFLFLYCDLLRGCFDQALYQAKDAGKNRVHHAD